MKKSSDPAIIPMRGQNDGKAKEYSDAAGLFFDHDDPANQLTRQEDKHDADINNIVNRFLRTGQLPASRGAPNIQLTTIDYGLDLQGALNFTRSADRAWDNLPADVRARYKNKAGILEALEQGTLDLRTDAEILAASQKKEQTPSSTSTPTEPKT